MNTTSTVTKQSLSQIPEKLETKAILWDPRDHIPQQTKDLLSRPSPNYRLAFLNIIQQLKIQKRTGWLDYQINDCESIADHMYRLSMITMLINNPSVNRDKCVRIALVHDMAESIVGDITPVNPIGKKEKSRREWETIKYVCNEIIEPVNKIAAKEIMNDWLAYENIESLEARYVKDIDKYELFVQCFEYEQKFNGNKNFQEFFQAMKLIKTEEVMSWAQDLVELRAEYFNSLQ